MSEEFASQNKYKDQDIVWVKLGPSWWPGEVKDFDSLPTEILDFKKPPLVVVKFFDEDSYEYVRSWTSIYPYNCEKKNEFIKKGMAGFRSKLSHMEKFPKDVTTAEVRTGGNPNILSDPIFIPENRKSIIAKIFGTPSPKGKSPKDKKQRSSMKHSKDTAYITHRRFLGSDDYKAYICIQYPGKGRTTGDSEDEEVIRINNEPEQQFTCHTCSFTTRRLEVLVLHTKSHIQGDYMPGLRRPKRPIAIRKKKEKARKPQRTEGATSETGSNSSDDDHSLAPKQKKRKTKVSRTKTGKVVSAEEPKQATDIRSDLLAEWDLSEDEMNTTNEDSFVRSLTEDDNDSKLAESLEDTDKEESFVVSDETMKEDAKEIVEAEDDIITVEHEIVTVANNGDDIVIVEDEVVVDQKAEETSQPKMDKETREAIKSCFDFDEDDEEEHALIINAAAASGRKIPRVIPPTERRRSDEELFAREEDVPASDKEEILKVSESFNRKGDQVDASFEELMEETAVPDLPEVQNVLKCEQNFHCVKTVKFPDKPEEVGCSPKRRKRETRKQAAAILDGDQSKPVNPKKRFVKSFEDFENEIRRKELEEQQDKRAETKTDSDIEDDSQLVSANKNTPNNESVIEMKTKILSKIVEEANINEESKIKIMSKMQKKSKTYNKTVQSHSDCKSGEEVADEENTANKITGSLNEEVIEVAEDATKNSDATEHTSEPDIVASSKEEGTVEEKPKQDSDVTKEIMEQEVEETPTGEQIDATLRSNGTEETERIIETVLEKSGTAEPTTKSPNEEETTKHSDIVLESLIPESQNEEELPQKSHKRKSKTLGISRKKRRSKRRNSPKKSLHSVNDDEGVGIDTKFSETSGQEETISAIFVEENVQSKDSVPSNETLVDVEGTKDQLEDKNDEVKDESKTESTVNIIAGSTDTLGFEESLEDAGNPSTPAPNYEDIISSHNDNAEYEEIQEVVSEIVNQLEEEDTRKDHSKEDLQQTASDYMTDTVSRQDSQENNQLPKNLIACSSEIDVDIVSDVQQSKNVEAINEAETKSISEMETLPAATDQMDAGALIDETGPATSGDTAEEPADLPYSSDTKNVPQNENEEIDSEDTKNSKLPEDDSLSFGLLSQTEREDFSPIGLASLHLPEDAILQPKKPKKRKKHSRHKSSKKKRSKETSTSTTTEQRLPDAKLPEEIFSSQIPIIGDETVQDEEFVSDVKDKQVTEETIYTEEVALDDILTGVSTPEVLVTEEIVHEDMSTTELEDSATATVDKVDSGQTDIESIEIIHEDIVLINDVEESTEKIEESTKKIEESTEEIEDSTEKIEESTEKIDQIINFDDDVKKECVDEVSPHISANTGIEDSEQHLEIQDFVVPDETIETIEELSCGEVAVQKNEDIESHHSHSDREISGDLMPEDATESIIEYKCSTSTEDGSVGPETSPGLKESENPVIETSSGLDDTIVEMKEMHENVATQNVIEPNIATVESSIEETKEDFKPAIEEMNCETVGIVEEISAIETEVIDKQAEENSEQEHRKDSAQDVGKLANLSEYLEELQDETPDSKEYNVDNSENSMQVIEQRECVDYATTPALIDARVDLEPPPTNTNQIAEDNTSPADAEAHKVEIQCTDDDNDLLKFSIHTNLSNLSSREELSALALTSLAELKSSFDSDSNTSAESPEKNDVVVPEKISEPELVAIEANLTVVSEKDLADGQVEITAEKVISAKKTSVLAHFSVDFSDSTNESTSLDTGDASKLIDFESKGTEFSSKAITKELRPKCDAKKSNTYEQYELLDILEGNSDFDKKAEVHRQGKAFSEDICDFEEHIPSQIVCSTKFKQDIDEIKDEIKKKETPKSSIVSTTTKLMERLIDNKIDQSIAKENLNDSILMTTQDVIVNAAGQLLRKNSQVPAKLNIKPIIISEQIIRPASNKTGKLPQQNVMDDIEDVEAFVIHKDIKKHVEEVEPSVISPPKPAKKPARSRSIGKAKILQQTIITPAGEILQPAASKAKKSTAKPILSKLAMVKPSNVELPTVSPSIISSAIKTQVLKTGLPTATTTTASLSNTQDDNDFDINSMPIVLSDAILTPESIENMPIVIGGDTHTEAQTKMVAKQATAPKILTRVTAPPAVSTAKAVTIPKLSRPRILQTVASKAGKNPAAMSPNTTKSGKYILVPQGSLATSQQQFLNKKALVKRALAPGSSSVAPEPTGNKIMIVTNQQGQQQRLLLTPAQQKMLGYQNQGQKVTKAVVKSNMLPKTMLSPKGVEAAVSKSSMILSQKVSAGHSLVPLTSQAMTTAALAGRNVKAITKKVPLASPKVQGGKTPKTILITTKHGQTVKKITTTDDDIERQVAAQLKAIKASAGMKPEPQTKFGDGKIVHKPPAKRSYPKKVEPKQKPATAVGSPPPLVGSASEKPDRPLKQVVIQDAVGNQTTITEGQILALPNETVGGQPHSYVLVTLDHAGNLTPLNNEALMSLDPNMGLGGDLSNMVLQIDQGALSSGMEQPVPLAQAATVKLSSPGETLQAGTSKIEIPVNNASVSIPMMSTDFQEPLLTQDHLPNELSIPDTPANVQTILPSTNGEPGQQLIVTGDPIATQKFLESLTEGTADLADIIANAEGKSILIQAGDQQILINADGDGQMMLSDRLPAPEGGKGTDILAAALADTDVFAPPKMTAYPMSVGNVLETSLTLGSPIMTPLEVPSTNAKKVEVDVLAQVSKNVDLPITITDPNISQTVANQQAMVNELQSNLDLNLSTAMAGPGYSFSLPSLDEHVDMGHKPFNSSMPLLNDEVEEAVATAAKDAAGEEHGGGASEAGRHDLTDGSFLEVESRFTLGGEMCSSLSEPPPEMFDISEVNNFMDKHAGNVALSLQSTPDAHDALSKDGDTTDFSTHADSSNEGSCEIPVQPKIVTSMSRSFGAVRRFEGGSEGGL